MSLKVTALVWEHAPVSGNHLTLLLAMADIADDAGERIFKGEDTLAEMLRIDVRTVRRLLKALSDPSRPLIERAGRRNGKSGHFDTYRIVIGNLVRFSRHGAGVKRTGQSVRCELSTGQGVSAYRTNDASVPDNSCSHIDRRPIPILDSSCAPAPAPVENSGARALWQKVESAMGHDWFASHCSTGVPTLENGQLVVLFANDFRARRALGVLKHLEKHAGVPVTVRTILKAVGS